MAQSPSPSPPGKPLQVPFSILLFPRSTVAQGKVSVLGISTSAQISEMNLLISVVLCRFPGLPVLLPRDPNNIACHLGLKWRDLDYSNKKENTKLHFLMSIILPSCKAVWGTNWDPCGNQTQHHLLWHLQQKSSQNHRQPVSGKSKEMNQLFWLTVSEYNILNLPNSCLRHGTVFQI